MVVDKGYFFFVLCIYFNLKISKYIYLLNVYYIIYFFVIYLYRYILTEKGETWIFIIVVVVVFFAIPNAVIEFKSKHEFIFIFFSSTGDRLGLMGFFFFFIVYLYVYNIFLRALLNRSPPRRVQFKTIVRGFRDRVHTTVLYL